MKKIMVLFRVAGGRYGWLITLGLLLLAAVHVPIANGQRQVGVSLVLRGQTIPNNSLVNFDDLLYRLPSNPHPSNANGLQTLMCVTDLVDCCETQALGNWHLPTGFGNTGGIFQINRGQNEEINGEQIYGSVRLWRQYTPQHRGLFHCELPDANGVNQTLYVNIIFFTRIAEGSFRSVSISSSAGPTTAGETYSLKCSATLHSKNPSLPDPNIPSPTFEWFFGPNGNAPLPSGLTPMATVLTSGTYTSTLQFSPLSQSHAGNYTCQLGAGSLMDSTNITVAAPPIIVMVSANLNPPLMVEQTGHTLTCGVSEAENLISTITYQWTRYYNGSTSTKVKANSLTLSLSPLQLSHAGNYSCSIISTLLNNPVTADNNQSVMIQIPDPQSVIITSRSGLMVLRGSDVTLICSVQMNETILVSELSLLMVNASLIIPDGTVFELSNPVVSEESDTTLNFIIQVNSFGDSDVGNYSCNATIRPQPSFPFLTGMGQLESNTIEIVFGSGTGGPDSGAIAGSVIFVVIALTAIGVALAFFIFWFMKRRSTVSYQQTAVPSAKQRPPIPVAYSKRFKQDDTAYNGSENRNRPQITKFPLDTTAIEGEGVYFQIKVSGEPLPTVMWYHDGEPIREDYAREIEADGSLAIPSAELKHSGVYKAVATNKYSSEERELKLMVNEEGGASTYVATDDIVSSTPIPILEFGKYVAQLHTNMNQPFKDLYQILDTGEEGHSTEYATSPEIKPLNRFANIVVYDDNRIVLKPLADASDCQRDYINACYVDGYSIPNKFMVTQGPLPKTVVDFWRLIWQERPPTIVMVTNVKEGTRIKCQQYWPESGKKDFGPFQVTITDQQIFADYTIRILSVSLGSEGHAHKVTQYHFTAWPDHGVPDYATSILAFHRRVKAHHQPAKGPMLVHCSAGVGRTGTFIVIDNILEQIEKKQVVDIPGAITMVRQRRMKMVQTHEQFTFIHDAILESVTCGDTQITATNLRMSVTKMKRKDNQNEAHGFLYQFKILEQVSPNPKEVHCSGALNNSERNRSDKYLPADLWRINLKGERPDYIHAVYINGYKHKRAFIVAEGPMQSTVRNFWKMICDCNCSVVVMTSGLIEGGQEASAQYWPDSGIAHYGEFAVDLLEEEKLGGFMIRKFSITDTKTQTAQKVTQFHIKCWKPDGQCSNLKSITDVIEEMTKVQIRSGNKPIVVHCSDTVTRSGMFCAIATTIERCKTEGVVDVFQVVKALRVQKPGAVPTVENYKQVFDTVLVYLESFDTYANFQNL